MAVFSPLELTNLLFQSFGRGKTSERLCSSLPLEGSNATEIDLLCEFSCFFRATTKTANPQNFLHERCLLVLEKQNISRQNNKKTKQWSANHIDLDNFFAPRLFIVVYCYFN